MCSGPRDAVNPEGKLDLVLGSTDNGLLATYGPERVQHISDFIGRRRTTDSRGRGAFVP